MQLWKSRVALALLSVHLQSSWADMGFLSWGALDQDNSSVSGNTLYGGDGTFYGQQGGQNSYGTCSYGSGVSNTLSLDWSTDVVVNIAMNDAQFQEGLACGMCLYFQGTGTGLGLTPIPKQWQFGIVDNLCPECAFGSIDIDQAGDGRWGVEWFPAPCHVGKGSFKYVMNGGAGNPYWFQFTVSNTRVPVAKVEMNINGQWNELRRTFNNMYAANGGPFNTWPLPIRVTSVLNDTVYDLKHPSQNGEKGTLGCEGVLTPGVDYRISSNRGGQGKAQFPDRGPAVFPKPGTKLQSYKKMEDQQQTSAQPVGPPPPTTAWPNSSHASFVGFSAFVVADSGQCGGSGSYCSSQQGQCKDAVWDNASCNPGLSCQRQNASWWSCQPVNAPQQKWNFSPLPTGIDKVVGASNPTGLLESGAAPPQSLTFAAALASLQNYTVLDGGQCGGKDFYCKTLVPAVCLDAVWEKASCRPGYTCSRHNASWWGCDSSPSSSPVASTQVQSVVTAYSGPSNSGQTPPLAFQVVAAGQCGGNGGYCSQLQNGQCKNAVWDGAKCPNNYSCQRWNDGWWQCMPIMTSTFLGRKLRML